MNLAVLTKNARLKAMGDMIDTAGGGTLTFYTAPQPAAPEDAITDQTLLVAVPCPVPFVKQIDAATMLISPFPETMPVTAGEPAWARLTASNGAVVADLTVGTDITLSSSKIFPGILVRAAAPEIRE